MHDASPTQVQTSRTHLAPIVPWQQRRVQCRDGNTLHYDLRSHLSKTVGQLLRLPRKESRMKGGDRAEPGSSHPLQKRLERCTTMCSIRSSRGTTREPCQCPPKLQGRALPHSRPGLAHSCQSFSKVWDIKTGKLEFEFRRAHQDPFASLDFSWSLVLWRTNSNPYSLVFNSSG